MGAPITWSVARVLVALGQNHPNTKPFTDVQLSQWASDEHIDFSEGAAALALGRMRLQKWVVGVQERASKGSFKQWRLTADGLQAAEAAVRSLPGLHIPNPAELSTRLWNLLRIRRRLTADEAAETLVDAGEGLYATAKKRIGELLAAWAKHSSDVVTVAQKREAGRIRYVLLQDIGRWQPVSKPGQMHPTAFANISDMPAIYRRASSPARKELA